MTLPVGATVYNKRAVPDDAPGLAAYLTRELDVVDRAIKDTAVHAARTVTSAFTVTLEDALVRADASAGAVTVTLPSARIAWGRIFHVKNVGTSGTVTVAAAGTELIDAAATVTLNMQYQGVTVQSTGTGWAVHDPASYGFRVENRTADPVSPTVGQLWLRTDL